MAMMLLEEFETIFLDLPDVSSTDRTVLVITGIPTFPVLINTCRDNIQAVEKYPALDENYYIHNILPPFKYLLNDNKFLNKITAHSTLDKKLSSLPSLPFADVQLL